MAQLDDNFLVIFGWMTNRLSLSGNELLTYAIVFGFSQDGKSEYTGGTSYISQTINCSKRTAYNSLDNLVKKGLIIKEQYEHKGVVFSKYRADLCKTCTTHAKIADPHAKIAEGDAKIADPHAKIADNNIINNKYINNIYNIYTPVIDYLNEKLGTNYRSSSAKTRKLIDARVNEGYTLDDFKKVIDKKVQSWKDSPTMCTYLRPETLFGNKFEQYLQEIPGSPKKQKREYGNYKQRQPGDPTYVDIDKLVNDLDRKMKMEMT